jgi:2-amino-4-hydroxy-6-hydroxymethyldihydropteridine diphosphokinase
MVGSAGDDPDVAGARAPEGIGVPVGKLASSVDEEPGERPRVVGFEMKDPDGDWRHGHASLAIGRPELARTVRAYIGLGANVGDARATLTAAVSALAALPGARLRGVSRLYRTVPVGVVDQPDFLNAVVALDVPAGSDAPTGASALLIALKGLERAFGRQRRRHWGPRELDLDLLVFGRARLSIERRPDGQSDDPAKAALPLTVPHSEARKRLFVLAPLVDLAPGLVPPGWSETVETARRREEQIEGESAAVPVATWDAGNGRWVAPQASGPSN